MPRKTRGQQHDDAAKKAKRMQTIIDCLSEEQRTGQRVTKNILAEKLKVSEKTIQRDMEEIPEYFPGYYVEFDRHGRTYYLMNDTTGERADFEKNSVKMENYTFFNLLMGLHILEQFQDSPVAERLRDSIENIASQLPEKPLQIELNKMNRLFSRLFIPIRKMNPTFFNKINECIHDHRVIKITYKPANGKQSIRAIQPIQLHSHYGDLYAIAWCRKREDIRIFALSRIKNAELTDEFFDPQDYPRIREYLNKQFGVFMDGMKNEYIVKLQFTKDQAPFIRERKWHKNQKTEPMKNGGLKLSFTTNHLFEVARWVLSWGPDVKVLAPPELKKSIKEQLQQALKQY